MIALTEVAWMKSSAVAQRLGIQTGTLKKWRAEGKGPKGWRRISRTVVMYPVAEVLRFEQTWHEFESASGPKLHSVGGVAIAN